MSNNGNRDSKGVRLANISELTELTGATVNTVKKRLAKLKGEKRGREVVYRSPEALRAFYNATDKRRVDNMDYQEARRLEAVERANKLRVEREVLEKERIPADMIRGQIADLYGQLRSLIQSTELPLETRNEILAAMGEITEEFAKEDHES